MSFMDYGLLVTKIGEELVRSGMSETEAGEAFGPASESELTYLADLYGTFAHRNPVFPLEDMEELKGKQVPTSVISFYRQYEPKWLPMFDSGVRLLGLDGILEENSALAPGVYLIKLGVVVFATTVGGHAVCLDLNRLNGDEPRVILVDHTSFYYDDDPRTVQFTNVSKEVYREYMAAGKPFTLSYELVDRCVPEISPTFSEFLHRLVHNEYEDVEKFLP